MSLAARALVALALMVGFYALAIIIAGVLLYLPYAEVVYAHRLHPKLAIVCIVGAGVILWSIVPRPDRFLPPGPRLEPAAHPRLFQRLTAVAQAVGQPMPAEVYLAPEVNAWVAQRGGWMGFGSRRVMGLGLPVLQVLAVSEIEAVLAHEFGHYSTGDTRLAPWVYKTRGAIVRTLQGLSRHSELLMKPFIWYGHMFLRITHAISRRQEYQADGLAARTIGPRPLADGLQKIHGAALAYDAYLRVEMGPVLNAGFRPPWAEGFARFLAFPSVAKAVSDGLEQQLREAQTDAYDTHPPLRDRVAALQKLPAVSRSGSDVPAISLLEKLPKLEARLLSHVSGNAQMESLKAVSWENAGMQALLPQWSEVVRQQREALVGLTPASLAEVCASSERLPRTSVIIPGDPGMAKSLLDFSRKLAFPASVLPSAEERYESAKEVLAMALAVALSRQGWELRALPGELYLTRGDCRIEPFPVVGELADGKLTPEAWRQLCRRYQISDSDLTDSKAD